MLTLTENATAMIRTMLDQPGTFDGAGVRISHDGDADTDLWIDSAVAPQAGDQIIEHQGARVFVGPRAAAALEGKALDARLSGDGKVQFVLASRT